MPSSARSTLRQAIELEQEMGKSAAKARPSVAGNIHDATGAGHPLPLFRAIERTSFVEDSRRDGFVDTTGVTLNLHSKSCRILQLELCVVRRGVRPRRGFCCREIE